MLTVTIIDEAHRDDLRLPNQPFPLFGLLLPAYCGEKWDYSVLRFPAENITQMCFPDEDYAFGAENRVYLGAYDGEACVGLAVLERPVFRYMYLCDIKVNADYRGRGVGTMLIESAKQIAAQQGYRGIYTLAQDNNLGACLFYLKNGFAIGGLDTRVYDGTPQENKKDIFFYCDAI